MDYGLILLAVAELVAFLIIIGTAIYSVRYLRRQIQRGRERKKATQQAGMLDASGTTDAGEVVSGFFYLTIGLGIIFVVGVIVLAVIKWSFGVVFG